MASYNLILPAGGSNEITFIQFAKAIFARAEKIKMTDRFKIIPLDELSPGYQSMIKRELDMNNRLKILELLNKCPLHFTIDADEIILILEAEFDNGMRGHGFFVEFNTEDFFDIVFVRQDDILRIIAITTNPAAGYIEYHCQTTISVKYISPFIDLIKTVLPKGSTNELTNVLNTGKGKIKRPRVELRMFPPELMQRLLTDSDLLKRGLSYQQWEDLIADRLSAMGLGVQKVGKYSNSRDGGIDLIAWHETNISTGILIAVQAKYMISGGSVGPSPVREFHGSLASTPCDIGFMVTNTKFTPDARWVASNKGRIIRLKDIHDVMRWLRNNFLDEAPFRDFPGKIDLAPNVTVHLPKLY